MQNVYEKLISCYESIREKIPFTPRVALVLGSGLGDYAEKIRVEAELDYHEIDGFPVSTVPGHAGKFIFGWIGSVPVVCMKGRVHFYEGYPVSDVVLPIRLMKRMGAELLFLTNASGGINPSFSAGDLMLLTDHISLFAPNPLIGQNFDELGVRFPDMTQVYDRKLQEILKKTAAEQKIALQEGVYAQLTGPSYETPAEVELLRRGYDVYVGKVDSFEVDFVAMNGNNTFYYQVALSVRDADTLQRELRPLLSIRDHYPKYILTMDDDPEEQYDGIRRINARDWLLGLTD